MWDIDIVDVRSRGTIVRRHGSRAAGSIHAAFAELAERLADGHVPGLVTTDEYAAYPEAVLATFGALTPVEKRGRDGRGRKPFAVLEPPPHLVYAQVDKQRDAGGTLVKVETRRVFGTPELLAERLAASPDSGRVNTAFIERQNGVDRGRNPRKARRAGTWSKRPSAHRAVSWLTLGVNFFCWPISTLVERERKKSGDGRPRTSAMELGRARAALSVDAFLRLRPIGFRGPTLAEIRRGQTEFHKPERSPERLKDWPAKQVMRKSFKRLGISARGLGLSTYSGP